VRPSSGAGSSESHADFELGGRSGGFCARGRARSCACEGAHTAGWKSPSGRRFTGLWPKATAPWQHGVESCWKWTASP